MFEREVNYFKLIFASFCYILYFKKNGKLNNASSVNLYRALFYQPTIFILPFYFAKLNRRSKSSDSRALIFLYIVRNQNQNAALVK